ncbi:hypothetical protein ACHJH3_06750 [Campylobacter sp. MOP7]|uniref:hypothetical protein n=1 Tax=Campylobacter canis TaxID=3378588 RepID=UPI00387E42F9
MRQAEFKVLKAYLIASSHIYGESDGKCLPEFVLNSSKENEILVVAKDILHYGNITKEEFLQGNGVLSAKKEDNVSKLYYSNIWKDLPNKLIKDINIDDLQAIA